MTPFDLASALPFALALRIGIVAVTVLAAPRRGVALRVAFLGSVAASRHRCGRSSRVKPGRRERRAVRHHASGFSLGYSIDGLSAWFLLVLSVVAIPIAIFSLGYLGGPHWSRRSAFLGASFNVLMGAVELVFVANDLVTFLLPGS